MKKSFLLVILPFFASACASRKAAVDSVPLANCPKVEGKDAPRQVWSLDGFSTPESVIYDAGTQSLFVSNIGGQDPVGKDGHGWIDRVSRKGKRIKAKWASGSKDEPLNAPKGMRIRNGVLWVSDIDRLVGIQVANGKQTVSVRIPGSKFLNDVNFEPNGDAVLVSDMLDDKIYAIRKDPSHPIYVEGPALESPNGILSLKNEILVASWGPGLRKDFSTAAPGRVLAIDTAKREIRPWAPVRLGNLDGLEADGPDAVLVSDWTAGKVYRLKKDGECRLLLEGANTADIAFIPNSRLLVVPLMGADRVVAYELPRYE